MNAFFSSPFSYYQLLCMYRSRYINTKINNRTLLDDDDDDTASFQNPLAKDRSVTEQNLSSLAIEMFKVTNGIAPTLWEIFIQQKSTS